MAEQEDFYSILGVARTASQDEIHKAWRKLAMKYHPDRNNGDKAAEEMLKKINVAHDVLSDPQKRQVYDQVGHEAFIHGGTGASGSGADGFGGMHFDGDLNDIFSSFFGGGFGGFGGRTRRDPNAPTQGEDLQYELEITFKEAYFGAEKDITYPRHETCDHCHGNGCEPGSSRKTCPHCNGRGVVINRQGFFQMQSTCPHCGGSGTIVEKPCTKCRGRGSVSARKKLTLHIPPGVDTGTRLRSADNGETGKNGGPYGDLYVLLTVRPHPVFRREGNDLHCEIPIPFPTAALGGTIKVPTMEGEEEIAIDEGTQHGAKFRVKKAGFPSLRSRSTKGDLYVHVTVEVPTHLGTAQKKKLKEFQESCSQNEYPQSKTFWERLKNIFR